MASGEDCRLASSKPEGPGIVFQDPIPKRSNMGTPNGESEECRGNIIGL